MIATPQFVDVDARKRASAAIQRFFLRLETTNRQYEKEFPDSKDAAIRAIFWMLWGLYDDLREHKMNGKHELNTDVRMLVKRCVAFLDSDLAYEWPVGTRSFRHMVKRWMQGVGGLLRKDKRRSAMHEREGVEDQLKRMFADEPRGDSEVWPFFREKDVSAN